MPNNAVGLEQVGGVTQSAKGMVQNADGRVSASRNLLSASDGNNGRMVGPAGDLMRTVMSTQAGAGGVHAVADDMYAAIGRFGSPRGAQAETDALVDELLPGYRRPSAA